MRPTLRRLAMVSMATAFLAISGCAPMIGAPSTTMLARQTDRTSFQAAGEKVTDQDCMYWTALFLFFGKSQPTHEGVLGRMLEKNQADVLLDAKFVTKTMGIPYIFMMNCAEVSGTPATYKAN